MYSMELGSMFRWQHRIRIQVPEHIIELEFKLQNVTSNQDSSSRMSHRIKTQSSE